ncbi:MAG: threonine--tRNA ligase [Polyangiaceae bacterium]
MEKDDHRQIGRRLDLFHFQEEAPGMAFWHPRGLALYRALEDACRRHVRREGYREVRSPQLCRKALWERSGHWDHFRENMFCFAEDDDRWSALKPVNCPGHLELARQMQLSWRDLPLRLAEFGLVHRNEQSGNLSGLFRLRQFVQDDGHILCRPDQAVDEIAKFCRSLPAFYAAFGFDRLDVALSGRPESRVGSDEVWDLAEKQLRSGAERAGFEPRFVPGGGAFYGPKIEVSLLDALGRSWQCGTIQLDFFLPQRFGVEYVAPSGEHRQPVMLHRALAGSLERFLGVVLEHHGGRLPAWLSPEQVRVVPIGRPESAARALGAQVADDLAQRGLRVEVDDGDESLAKRIAMGHLAEVPILVVLGDREVAAEAADVRSRGGREVVPLERLSAHIAALARPPV